MSHKSLMILAGVTIVTGMLASAQTGDANKPAIVGGLAVMAELDSSLDSKKMKAGDSVTAHSLEALKIQGKTVLPSGTKFLGHVIQASARSKGDADSLLAIQFEKAVLKSKEDIPIGLVIRAIATPPRRSADEAGPGGDPMERRNGVTTSPMSGRSSAPIPENPGARGNGGEAGDPPSGLNADGRLTPASRGVYGIAGVRLASDTTKTPPISIFVSTDKSVHLESGIRLLFFSTSNSSNSSQ
jgi:hypothetical protein